MGGPGNSDIPSITSFLRYLHQSHELEIYYMMLNQVGIKSFSNGKLEITSNDMGISVRDQIRKLLFAWTGLEWDVIITKESGVEPMKAKLISQLKSTREWQIISDNFPGAKIIDLLLKT